MTRQQAEDQIKAAAYQLAAFAGRNVASAFVNRVAASLTEASWDRS